MSTATKTKVDIDIILHRLERADLGYVAEELPTLLNVAVKNNLAAQSFLDQLLEAELGQREERRIKTAVRLSGPPPALTLGGFDFAFQPSVDKGLVETLAACAWIGEHGTALIQVPAGFDKTHLAVSFGVKAVGNGFSVAFFRLDDLLQSLKQNGDLAPRRLRREKDMNVALLIIDEVGFQPMNRQEASLFFRMISYRY